jgi:DNA polymerase III subunit delta'
VIMAETGAQIKICERFRILEEKGRMGHAYLFTGPQAIGKSETVQAIARMLNCEQKEGRQATGCGECSSCRKILVGQHPDVYVIDAGEEASIKITAIRELIQRLQLRPFEARSKVVLVKNAELMTLESSNAFLKTLEEPTRDTVIFLTSAAPELLLGTIRSRCHTVPFFTAARVKVAQDLAAQLSVPAASAHFFSYFADGCAGRGQQLAAQGFFEFKNQVIDQIILGRPTDPYLKELLGDKVQTRFVLEIFLSWFRDLMVLRATGAEGQALTHQDRRSDLDRLAKTYQLKHLYEILEGIGQTMKYLDENLNVKIAFYLLMEKIWVRTYKSV